MAPRRRPVVLLALLASSAPLGLAAPSAARAGRATAIVTVRAPSVLHMAGSDIYCAVNKQSSGPAVACFHDPGGPSSGVRKGYAIVASDEALAVEPPGTTTPKKTMTNPSFASIPPITGGASHDTVIDLGLHEGVFVGGSHMAIAVEEATGGGNAIAVLYVDAKLTRVVGSYTIAIGKRYVTIGKVAGKTVTTLLYRHPVYS